MKRFMGLFLFVLAVFSLIAVHPAYAPLVTVQSKSEQSDDDSAVDDSGAVDLSGVDTDQPVQSPSLENETDEKK